ncbi:hypothetical protein R3X26_15185 [Vibrio sp. TH_r3]|uniref:hypothetical protein n=1 Tax=Vibrio sp. TH_r3 TaxID=3082084 RepID=UPI0029557B7D|nr:hypothetical protein [Vibrio sp. TH_r3]MDV7105748.1 hypothetical protein [Vibrio sp. TH_r3]
MAVDVIISNLYSLIGTLLLTGSQSAFSIPTLDKSYGYFLAILGSIFMLVTFYRLNSITFFLFNIFWLLISIYGLMRLLENNKSHISPMLHQYNTVQIVHFFLLFLVLVALIANILGDDTWASIAAVSIFTASYTACSYGVISQSKYVCLSVLANLASLQHFIVIQNYVASVQVFIVVLIASYGMFTHLSSHQEE